MAPDTYRVLTGMNYPGRDQEERREPGDLVDDIPKSSLPWLLEQGHIEKVTAAELRAAAAQGGDG